MICYHEDIREEELTLDGIVRHCFTCSKCGEMIYYLPQFQCDSNNFIRKTKLETLIRDLRLVHNLHQLGGV